MVHRGERAIEEVFSEFATFCGCEMSGLRTRSEPRSPIGADDEVSTT
jgi:hypothetical protein